MTTNISNSVFVGWRIDKKYFWAWGNQLHFFPDKNSILYKLAAGFEAPDLPVTHLWHSYLS